MKIYTLLIILFSLLTNAQNTTPVLEDCNFGVERLNAELHQGRLVDGNKIFANFSINDSIKKIDYLRLNLVFNKKISKSKLNLLKKSLIDKYKIAPSEIAIDDKDNSVEIIKKNIPNYKGVSTHFITLYLNQKITKSSIKLFLKSGQKLYESSFVNLKDIKSKQKN